MNAKIMTRLERLEKNGRALHAGVLDRIVTAAASEVLSRRLDDLNVKSRIAEMKRITDASSSLPSARPPFYAAAHGDRGMVFRRVDSRLDWVFLQRDGCVNRQRSTQCSRKTSFFAFAPQ
jgi:hypothetical protein